MAILGKLLKKGILLRESLEQLYSSPIELQKRELKNLLIQASSTKFGQYHDFSVILKDFKKSSSDDFYESFARKVPICDYETIYKYWWSEAKKGEGNVSWPGRVKYFALSSGTTGSPSKYIPVTKEMVRSIKRTSIRQILSMSKYDLPASLFSKGILMLGGSTDLRRNGDYFEGDLSGITASQIPFWFQHFYKPGKAIAKTRDWEEKLREIVKKAPSWDIGIVVGVPAWLQLLLEEIIKTYQVKTIHDIWPNLKIFVHGGVSFEPYKNGFEHLLRQPLIYMETYLASEGFFAFQAFPDRKSMRLVLNGGIFYEFIPFKEQYFDTEGNLMNNAVALKIDQVKSGVDYAMVISTNSGAWRYLIGDVIRFVSVEECEIVITGRTKMFLNLCGEHLSIDNINKAIEHSEIELHCAIREFTVVGKSLGQRSEDGLFSHDWFIGSDDSIDELSLLKQIDDSLKALNDDYAVEREHALKTISIKVLPTSIFYEWMHMKGKIGGQNKFPRVLKGDAARNWELFLENQIF